MCVDIASYLLTHRKYKCSPGAALHLLDIADSTIFRLTDKFTIIIMSSQSFKHHFTIQPGSTKPPIRDSTADPSHPKTLPPAKETKLKPTGADNGENASLWNASLFFVGTATTILSWEGIRIMTDPNFLHAGDHVHLGPGVTGTRKTNPAVDLEELPRIDAVLLSHYHADHFDEKVESSLRRDLPIVTTPHAKHHLHESKSDEEKFTDVYDLDFFESCLVSIPPKDDHAVLTSKSSGIPAIKVTGMPGKHIPDGILSVANDLIAAVPPTNGWMVELGYKPNESAPDSAFTNGYRIYISGDTLMVDDLKEIPKRYADKKIDLMLVHLGGTTIPSPKLPLLMVTMDAKQGVQLMRLINPEVTIPIHYDDYDVFLSPLSDFKKAVEDAGWSEKVVYLDRGDEYRFSVAN
jgi:L-ascorbate metabolism protein UlaG (beta-lactamase superfamily)